MTWTPTPEEREKRWLAWLYETHSAVELRRWARQMQFFRFCRAQGGHANDGDRLMLTLRAPAEQDVIALFQHFGWTAQRFPLDPPQPQPGVAYTSEQYAQFPTLIREHPTLGQPGWQQILGHPCYGYVGNGLFALELQNPDNTWEVDERAVQAAIAVESLMAPLHDLIVDPPLNNRHCICPRFYPELFS